MKKKITIILVLIFLLSLAPAAWRTVEWASDAHGLVVLATLDPDEMTFNPYARNGYLINQEVAIWMLKTFEYPYNRCSGTSEIFHNCEAPLVGWVGRTLDMHGPAQTERGYRVLDHFIERGEDINQLTDGLAPVHEAILFRNSRYLSILLEAGADTGVAIESPGRDYDGLDAIQFLEFLESASASDFDEVRYILEQHRPVPDAA